MRLRRKPGLCILAVGALIASDGWAQSAISSAVAGTIHDPSGASVVGAEISVKNLANDKVQKTTSDSEGAYNVEGLAPGSYEITAAKYGFAGAKTRLVAKARRPVRADLELKLAAVDEGDAPSAGAAKLEAPRTEEARWEAMEERIAQLERELAAARTNAAILGHDLGPKVADEGRDKEARQDAATLLATTTTEPSLLPRLPSVRTEEPSSLAANTPLPQAGQPKSTTPAPPSQAAVAAPAASSAQKDGIIIPEALQGNPPPPAVDNETPFAFGDFTWLNGTPRNHDTVLDTKFFTPEVRFDTHYMEDFNQPLDHTIVGSTESFRSGEVQIEQASVGGDFHWENVRGRILFMEGLFATTTPRNDASSCCPGIGQWMLADAYRYVSEAYGGYHFDVQHGLNVDAGIFVSYIGLFSYYNFDNWTYQPSYVSSNTPWFFNGVRIQWFPTNKMKIEPWFINGWQSYAKYNGHPGLGGQFLWMPKDWFKLVSNEYGFGEDNVGLPHTQRIHTDNSIEVKYYSNPTSKGISKMAFSLTGDAGCQYGGGLTCTGAARKGLKSSFLGWMLYDRMWLRKDLLAVTLGGGQMNNTGRYLTLLPPIDGASAFSGTPYFTENPGQPAKMWDSTVNLQYMPRQYLTWWWEVGYRHADIPYFAGRGGVTPPGGNNGLPQYYTCNSGASSGNADLQDSVTACASQGGVWFPDLRHSEAKLSMGVMVKF
jgi:hypothetical protein